MDLNSTYAPPINNACVPDIYNRLDAEVIERTRVANNQLNMRLLLQQKILGKYKQDAEKFRLVEKSRVVRELARINQTLPTAPISRGLDDKVLEDVSESQHPGQVKKKKKSYLAAKNDDPVCRRCYIHHLPTKKKFYKFKTHALPSAGVDSHHVVATHLSHDQKNAVKPESATARETKNIVNDIAGLEVIHSSYSQDQGSKFAERLVPAPEAFKFLEIDKWGRERWGQRDLSLSLVPRLVPNEIWKHVVKDVCNQCSNEHRGMSSSLRHQSNTFTSDRIVERRPGTRSRRPSVAHANRTFEKSEQYSGKMKGNSRMNTFRRPSIAVENKPHFDTLLHSAATGSLHEINPNTRPHTRSSTVPKSLSRANSFLMKDNSSPSLSGKTKTNDNKIR